MKILRRHTNEVLFEDEHSTMKETVENAVIQGVSLEGADLEKADLSRTNLSKANLEWSEFKVKQQGIEHIDNLLKIYQLPEMYRDSIIKAIISQVDFAYCRGYNSALVDTIEQLNTLLPEGASYEN